VPNTHKMPLSTARVSCHGRTSTVGTPLRTQNRFDQLPLGIAEFSLASHASF
jgi:hypothetical protein